MGFECPYYLEGQCKLQKGVCQPAIGKCILKGKAVKARHIKQKDKE